MDVLKTQSLNVSVWHNDTFGRNAFLGKVDLDLSEWDFSNTQINEYALKARVNTTPTVQLLVAVIGGVDLMRLFTHSCSILQSSLQSPASPASHVMDSRGQMRVALRFLPQTSHSEFFTFPIFVTSLLSDWSLLWSDDIHRQENIQDGDR